MKTVSCPQGLAYGASCTFACEAGYDIIGDEKVTCELGEETSASGVWSSVPKCDGEWSSVPKCDGEWSSVPKCDGEWSSVPKCDGEGSSVPKCDGEWSSVPTCDGEWSGEPKCDGEWSSVPTCDGEWSGEPLKCDGELTYAGQKTRLFNLDILHIWLKYRETG